MIKHIVMWRLKDHALNHSRLQNAELVKEKLEALAGKIPGLIRIEVGLDMSATPESFDIVLVSEFESRQALKTYQVDPAHQAVIPFIKDVVSERHVVDYEV